MSAANREEQARAELQSRLAVLFKVMFWGIAALIALVASLNETDPLVHLAPRDRIAVYIVSAFGLAMMALVWRGLLVGKRQLSLAALHRVDYLYSIAIGTCFGVSAYLQADLKVSGYMSMVYSTFTIFARTLLVPSSAGRTFATSVLTFAPMSVAAIVVAHGVHEDLPGPQFFFGFELLSMVAIALATAGSSVIYGLRKQVSAAARQLGSYALEGEIGRGGMGTVYRANHTLLRRPTAIKLMQAKSADALEHFEEEVQAMSELSHPNTVVIYDYGRSLDGEFYYAMEYLGGGINLHTLVKRHGKLPSGRVTKLLGQVCGALQEAHDRNLVHRDIKPANIIACVRGGVPDVAKVLDFGLVKDVAKGGATTQTIKGTIGFIAPEVATDPDLVGPGVDLYAIGCVAYYLLTGKQVFEGGTAMEQMRRHVKEPAKPPSSHAPGISPELDAIVMRCLEKHPRDRFASARDLATALREVPCGDWNDAQAREWWRAKREQDARDANLAAEPTRTITVDIGRRA